MTGLLRGLPSLSRTASPLPSPTMTSEPTGGTNSPPDTSPELPSQAPTKSNTSSLVGAAKRSVSTNGLSRKKEGSASSVQSVKDEHSLPNPSSEPGRARSTAPPAPKVANAPAAERQPSTSRSFGRFLNYSSRSASPAPSPTPGATPTSAAEVSSGPEASLVSKVALKLSELVNHAFPTDKGIVWNGRAATKPEVTKNIGHVIVSELKHAESDHYLLRSLIRSAILRNLTLFLGRLEAMPASTEVFVPKSIRDLGTQPAGQRFNLENVRSAYELRAALDQICQPSAEFRSMPGFVADALRPWSVKLDNYMSRLVNPLVLAIKLAAADTVSAARSSLQRAPSTGKVAAEPAMTSVAPAPAALPSYLRDLHAQLEAAGQLFKSLGCHKDLDRWIVNIGSHLVWKAMLNYACRPCPPPLSQPSAIPPHVTRPNTSSRGKALPLLRTKPRGASPPPATSPEDPHNRLVKEVAAFRAIISAFATPVLSSPTAPDEELLRSAKNVKELCDAFHLLPEIPSDDESDGEPELAHEAMHEALLALGSFELTIRALRWPDELTAAFIYDDDDSSSDEEDPAQTPSAVFQLTGPGSPATRVAAQKARHAQAPSLVPLKMPEPTLDRALDTLPPLITFHLLASRLEDFRLPHEIWQLSGGWQQYDAQLHGFSAGDNFKEEVGWEMVAELDRLRALRPLAAEETWPALLRCAVKCEVGT